MNYYEIIEKNPGLFDNTNALFEIITDKALINKWSTEEKERLLQSNKPLDLSNIGIVYEDNRVIIFKDLVKFPNGYLGSYFRLFNRSDLLGGQGVVILATLNNKYLLLNQYRHPIRSWSLEIPRGFGEPNTPAEVQAENEIREEVEGVIKNLIDLGDYHNNTGLEANKIKLFFAELSSIGSPEINEGIESYKFVSLQEFDELIKNAEISDGFTIAAYTRAKLRGLLH